MIEYKIICKMYLPQGGAFKYAENPKYEILNQSFTRQERETFIESALSKFKDDMIYDEVEYFRIDYKNLTVNKLTKELIEQMQNDL